MLIFICLFALIAIFAIFMSLYLSDDLNNFQFGGGVIAIVSCFLIAFMAIKLDSKSIKVYNRSEQVDIDVVKYSNQFILIDSVTAISKYDSAFYKRKDNYFKRIE